MGAARNDVAWGGVELLPPLSMWVSREYPQNPRA